MIIPDRIQSVSPVQWSHSTFHLRLSATASLSATLILHLQPDQTGTHVKHMKDFYMTFLAEESGHGNVHLLEKGEYKGMAESDVNCCKGYINRRMEDYVIARISGEG